MEVWPVNKLNLRYEKKFLFRDSDLDRVADLVGINGFREEYQQRTIHNVYFDTETYSSYNDHLAGIMNRQKLRYRWYTYEDNTALKVVGTDGTVVSKNHVYDPGFEIKAKSGDVGYKYRIAAQNDRFEPQNYTKILHESGEPMAHDLEGLLSICHPTLNVTYNRRYFRHEAEPSVRLTLDYDVTCSSANLRDGLEVPLLDHILCELKFPPTKNLNSFLSDSPFSSLAASLDYMPVRFSKYVYGFSKVYFGESLKTI